MKANKYLISIILLFVLGGGIYFLIQNRIINFNETNCVSCNSSQDSAIQEVTPQKIKTVGEETFEEMLVQDDKLSIDEVLDRSVFNSRTTFYRIFSDFTSLKPSEFIEEHKKRKLTA